MTHPLTQEITEVLIDMATTEGVASSEELADIHRAVSIMEEHDVMGEHVHTLECDVMDITVGRLLSPIIFRYMSSAHGDEYSINEDGEISLKMGFRSSVNFMMNVIVGHREIMERNARTMDILSRLTQLGANIEFNE